MTKFNNPAFEDIHNLMFPGEQEVRLKILKYRSAGCFPSMYSTSGEYDERYEQIIKDLEEDIKKAKAAMALYKVMRANGVGYVEEEE